MDINDLLICNNLNVYLYYVNMPCSIAANITENIDGSYTAYINSRLTEERQVRGFMHELDHVINGDLNRFENIQQIESRAHRR